jgi:hypothetical protein
MTHRYAIFAIVSDPDPTPRADRPRWASAHRLELRGRFESLCAATSEAQRLAWLATPAAPTARFADDNCRAWFDHCASGFELVDCVTGDALARYYRPRPGA